MRNLRLIRAFLIALSLAAVPAFALAQVYNPCVSTAVAAPPPPLPANQEQPPPPAPNYMWTPGYWAWGQYGYSWVPGTWVAPPAVGVYWTPGYWAFSSGVYTWSPGYWGPTVGFYGGINYGFGFFGAGFVGGVWQGNTFAYNTAFTNVNKTIIRSVYNNRTVFHGTVHGSRVSFNGGHGGISARPTPADRVAARERHFGRTPAQLRHAEVAGQNRNNLVAFNHGKPPVTNSRRPFGTVHGQPDFKALTTHDQTVAQQRAFSHLRLINGSGNTHGMVAGEPRPAGGSAHGPVHGPSMHDGSIHGSGMHGGGFGGGHAGSIHGGGMHGGGFGGVRDGGGIHVGGGMRGGGMHGGRPPISGGGGHGRGRPGA
jgi:WXXGXW repeat (2 copies)